MTYKYLDQINFPTDIRKLSLNDLEELAKELRSKTKVVDSKVSQDLPIWNFDGSSTGQATGEDSEVILKPVRVFIDSFRDNGKIVLCDFVLLLLLSYLACVACFGFGFALPCLAGLAVCAHVCFSS